MYVEVGAEKVSGIFFTNNSYEIHHHLHHASEYERGEESGGGAAQEAVDRLRELFPYRVRLLVVYLADC